MSILRNKKFTVIVIAIMAFIFFQSALPANLSSRESGRVVDFLVRLFQGVLPVDRQTMVFIVRKGAHFAEYTILGGFLVPAVKEWMAADTTPVPEKKKRTSADRAQMPGSARSIRFISWLTGTIYAVTDEIHQLFVPGRSCELRDIGIDSCGVLAGVLIAGLIMQSKERRS
ncbi:MAG: VanZ family protein [Lachnospiraceae bacterium]|nr:VanZ family protein [Lachnospiraceae bacterium]